MTVPSANSTTTSAAAPSNSPPPSGIDGGDRCSNCTDPKTTAAHLASLLLSSELTPACELSFGGPLDDFPGLPGIIVTGFGPLQLPLSDPAYVSRLANIGEEHPSIPGTWFIEPRNVQVFNPLWEQQLQKLLSVTITNRLGFSAETRPLQIRFDGMELHSFGFQVPERRDPSPVDQRIATLYIQLPSFYDGGELIVYRATSSGQSFTPITHSFGSSDRTSLYQLQYATHLADAKHEFRPIRSGYRVLLLYSVLALPTPDRPIIDLQQAASVHHQVFTHLVSLAEQQSHFHYMVSNCYYEDEVAPKGAQALQGIDHSIVDKLQHINSSLPRQLRYSFYLLRAARTYRHVDGYREFDDADMELEEEAYRDWYDLSGKIVGRVTASYQVKSLLGVLVDPHQRSELELWESFLDGDVPDSDYCGRDGMKQYFRTELKTWIVVAVPESSTWALRTMLGTPANSNGTLSRLLSNPLSLTATRFNAILASLPKDLCSPVDPPVAAPPYHDNSNPYHLITSTAKSTLSPNNIVPDLLAILISQSFTDSIPSFFTHILNPLTDPPRPQYVRAMRQPDLWAAMRPRALDAFSRSPNAYTAGINLVLDAIAANVPVAIWTELLTCITTTAVFPVDQLECMRNKTRLARILKAPSVWQALVPPMISALPHYSRGFLFGLDLLGQVHQSGTYVRDASCNRLFNFISTDLRLDPADLDLALKMSKWAREQSGGMWAQLCPAIAEAASRSPTCLSCLGVITELLVDPDKGEHDWPDIAAAVGANAQVDLKQVRHHEPAIVAVMAYGSAWLLISPSICRALASDVSTEAFVVCFSLIQKAYARFVPISNWSVLLPALCTQIQRLPPDRLASKDVQSKLWPILAMAHDPATTASVVNVLVHNTTQLGTHFAAMVDHIRILLPMLPRPFQPLLAPVFVTYYNQLHARCTSIEAMTPIWCIPAFTFPSSPAVESFMRSGSESMQLAGFLNFDAAQAWIAGHHPVLGQIQDLCVGVGWTADQYHVELRKVRQLGVNERREVGKVKQQMAEVMRVLQQIKGVVP